MARFREPGRRAPVSGPRRRLRRAGRAHRPNPAMDPAFAVADRGLELGEQRALVAQTRTRRGVRLVEREDALPVVLHADDDPAVLRRLIVKLRGKTADFGAGQALSRTVGVLSLAIVVQDEHREPDALAGLGILEHLPIAGRIAEGELRPAPDYEMDAFGLAGVVVVDEELRLLDEDRTAIRGVLVADSARCADHLLGRDSVNPLCIDAHEILPA